MQKLEDVFVNLICPEIELSLMFPILFNLQIVEYLLPIFTNLLST